MEINNELKETDIKNCTCYYSHEIIKTEDFSFDVFLDEIFYEGN